MAELLVRVAVKESSPENAPYVFQPGDVLVACPDGWPWSERELTNPEWRVIRSPLVPSEVDTLTMNAKQFWIEGTPDEPIRPREYYIDLDQLTAPARFRGPRSDEVIDLPRSEVINAITPKATGSRPGEPV